VPTPHRSIHFLFAASLSIITGCDSSSGGVDAVATTLSSKAIDGYIVGAQVYCDSTAHGSTQSAGTLDCPEKTILARISGGSDVGFDQTATTGGTPFVGELQAPADLGYVTPLSTLAVHLSSTDAGYNAARWNNSVAMLAQSLGQSELDLSADAASVMQLVRLNAQLHQIFTSFSVSKLDYAITAKSFSKVIEQHANAGTPLPVAASIDYTLQALNDQLFIDEPRLYKSEAELQQLINNVAKVNASIQQSLTPELIAATAAKNGIQDPAITINRSDVLMSLESYWQEGQQVSLENFESDKQSFGRYLTRVPQYLDILRINQNAFEINDDLKQQKVSIAISIRATDADDQRSLSLISNDVYISATAGDSSSLSIDLPENGLLHASGTSYSGVSTQTTVKLKQSNTFQSQSGNISVNTFSARSELSSIGIEDIFNQSGNFEITIAINGIKINESLDKTITTARQYEVSSGNHVVTGSGFRGYVYYEDIYN